MVDTERLDAVISVIDDFSPEIDELIADLGVADRALSRVDDRTIDADVHDAELDAYIAKLATAAALGAAAGADMSVGGRGGGAAAATATDEATESLSAFNVNMSDMHNALARLVPLIFVIIGALPAIIGALVGLAGAAIAAAAALGGLAGFAALGLAMQRGDTIGEGFMDILSEVREDFLEAFRPLAEQLAPLMEDGLDGLQRFFQELADRGQVLVEFSNAARDFGQFLLQTLPDAIANAGRVAQAFAPTFGALVDMVGRMNVLEGFMDFMVQALPAFADFITLLAAMIPHIMGMSIGFLRVTNALIGLFNVFFDVITLFGHANELMGVFTAAVLTAASAIFILRSQAVVALGSALVSLGQAIVGVIAGTRSLAISQLFAASTGITLTSVLYALVGILTLGIGAMAAAAATSAALGTVFGDLTGKVDGATSSLREFNRVSGRMEGRNPFGADPPDRDRVVGGGSGGGGDTVINIEGNADREEIDRAIARDRHSDFVNSG